MFWTNAAWCNVPALCTTSELRFLLPRQTKNKVKGYNITKAARHSKMQKVMSSTYRDGFTINTNTQGTCNCQNKMKQIWQLQIVFHSTHDFHKFNSPQTVFWILRSTKIISHWNATHTHTHTQPPTHTPRHTHNTHTTQNTHTRPNPHTPHSHTHTQSPTHTQTQNIYTVKSSTNVTTINI